MAKTDSKRKTRSDKFPLTLHKTGQFCKKIRGTLYYFGTNKQKALQRYLEPEPMPERAGSGVSEIQAVDDVLQRKFCIANSSVGCAVIDSERVVFAEQSTTEDHVSKEAFAFIVGLRFEDRFG